MVTDKFLQRDFELTTGDMETNFLRNKVQLGC